MSGVFSIASHAALQYLPVVASQEQTGCAHFLAGFGVMSSSCFDQAAFDSYRIIDVSKECYCPVKNTSQVRLKIHDCG
jgi:hypothetical protein